MMKFITKGWNALGAVIWATWDVLAATRNIAPFNAYVGENMLRWQNFQPPTQEYPAAEAGTLGVVTTQTLTPGVAQVNITAVLAAGADTAGIVILRDTGEITTPDWTMCIAVIPAAGGTTIIFIDSPLAVGTYHYRVGTFSNDGKFGTLHADGSASVTVV